MLWPMRNFKPASGITPREYELQVKAWLESAGSGLESFSVIHREMVRGTDGECEIDIVARFKILAGIPFTVLAECKKHRNPIKRELVQALHQKQQSIGANKAILFSTSAFQSGAVAFAKAHGIALVRLMNGVALYLEGSKSDSWQPPAIPTDVDAYAGVLYAPHGHGNPGGFNSHKPTSLVAFLEWHGP